MRLPFGEPEDELVRDAAWVARCVGRAEAIPLTEQSLTALAAYMERTTYEPGQKLFSLGDRPFGVCIVRDGRVELSVGSGKRRAVVAVLRPGDVEGDITWILGMPAPYTARALEHSACLLIPGAAFDRLLLDHPAVTRRWLSSVAARVSRSQARIVELLGRPLRQQVAALLLDEATDGEIRLPQRTLAAMLGVQRQSFNAALKQLESDGLVAVGYEEIRLLQPAQLEKVAAERLPRA